MIDLNILKIAGAFVAGLAGIIGILGQTRSKDNKLTRSGKWLFGMAIVGVVLAMGTQIWEWKKRIEDDRAAQRRNQELLVRLDKEVTTAAASLHEIRRAVTRFQTISFDWDYKFNSTDTIIGPYIRDLAKLAEDALSSPGGIDQNLFQVERKYETSRHEPLVFFQFDADSPAMPDEGKYSNARHYILTAVPVITLFKTPIPPEELVKWDDLIIHADRPYSPDLILKPNSGKVVVTFNLHKDEPKVPYITVIHYGMIASTSYSSGAIVSLQDLGGCQGLMNLRRGPQKEFPQLWSTANRYTLGCRVNDQFVRISGLTPTQTDRGLIYTFTFPTVVSAKSNH